MAPPETWNSATLNCDINIPLNIIETTSVTSSDPEWTATQGGKTVIDKDIYTHLHLTFGGETILMNEAGDNTVLVFGEKDESDDDEVGCPGELHGYFVQKIYQSIDPSITC